MRRKASGHSNPFYGYLAAIALAYVPGTPVFAGLYNSQDQVPALTPDQINFYVKELRGLYSQPNAPPASEGTIRAKLLQQIAQIEALKGKRSLSPVERADLGACYIRQGRYSAAITELSRDKTNNFLVLANLATAYHLNGDLRPALNYQEKALANWPSVWAPWTLQQLHRYRRAERFYQKLLESRYRESLRAGQRPETRPGNEKEVIPLDPLFPGVRYIGPGSDRAYEAGALAPEMIDKLPPDVSEIILQLVIWLPEDLRLYWQLAEILNVYGEVEVASQILRELDDLAFKTKAPVFQDLRQHSKILGQAAKLRTQLRLATNRFPLLTIPGLAPVWPGGIGPSLTAVAPPLLAPYVDRGPIAPEPDSESPPPEKTISLGWQHVGIGFLAGGLVAALLGLQWKEWRRRRRSSEPLDENAEPQPVGQNPGQSSMG
jgi:tetratricopeptide (TPR) repeat protein